MVHADAVIVFCDDVIKLLELGNIPKAIAALAGLLEQAEKEKRKNSKIYNLKPLQAKTIDSLTDAIVIFGEFREKVNELVDYTNRRKF